MSSVLDSFRNAKTEVPDIKFTIPSTGEDIFLRTFTTKEQKLVLKAIEKEDQLLINEAFDTLITNCVVSPNFKVGSLLTKDRDALLITLRKESVKDNFNFNWQCSNIDCQATNNENIQLDTIKFKDLKNKKSLSKELKLSDRDQKLLLKLPTRDLEKKMFKYVSVSSKKVSAVDVMNTTLAISIDKLIVKGEDGKTQKLDVSFEDKVTILDEIDISDKKKIEEFLKGIESYGYDLNLGQHTCTECGEHTNVQLEWSDFFLM